MLNYKAKINESTQFDAISIKLASPERIKEWSYGEVTKPETINYRTQRSERNGLFDEKIFGPDKDFECYCGKYRGIRYKGIICEKCGVEITRSIVRRDRMGHIELATPVAHIWFLKNVPSRISLVLGIPVSDLEKVVYFAGYIVTSVLEAEKARVLKDLESEFKSKSKTLQDEKSKLALKELALGTKRDIESLVPGRVLNEIEYHRSSLKYPTIFEAGIGAEAIYNILKGINLEKLLKELEAKIEHVPSTEISRLNKRISTIQWMINASTRPEWMFLVRVPVIPPAIRPMVPLDGGRYATSDVNDLYRRVINRNNRLKKLKEINAPDVILRNEKRILQEAVDALIDNTIRHSSVSGNQSQRRPLKSLSDNLKGKRGLFRQNLLGKRVDYSGRSVIVVGPELKLHQCGLPKHMALELFKPFIISELLKQELSYNIPGARRLIEDAIPEVWAILEEVIRGKYVLLNRAPTLHRLGIQAFQPILIEGNAIQLHPLVCTAFNADFDGDQMAVHVPLSDEAQAEARLVMAADKNILKPGNGEPVVSPRQDIVLGTYYMTRMAPGEKGEGRYYSSPNSAITACEFGILDFRAKIKVLPTDSPKYKEFDGKVFETSVGRLLFNSVLPRDYTFLNQEVGRKKMSELIGDLLERYSVDNVPPIIDKIKAFGFKYATWSGTTWGLGDVKIPAGKKAAIDKGHVAVNEVVSHYKEGLLSEHERIVKSVEIWQGVKSEIEKLIPGTLESKNPIYDVIHSEARGSFGNLNQMAGMKGIIQNVSGEALEFPILSCYKEGLTPLEYFITTHGSRKGLTDTALNTAKAGYLTRRLFDVAQDEIVTEEDCGTKEGTIIHKKTASGIEMPLSKNIKGRFLATDLSDSSGTLLFKRGHLITKTDAEIVDKASVDRVNVRSPLVCKSIHGLCVRCYGVDLGNNKPVELGEAVGTVAAQAIGEPGTQLTMRTFHAGGIASAGGDITAGLPRVEEIFEKRKPKIPAVISHLDGLITEIKTIGHDRLIVVAPEIGEIKGNPSTKLPRQSSGQVGARKLDNEYTAPASRGVLVRVGQSVKKGDMLTDGSADLDELFRYAGREKTENYIIHEVSKLYELQGAAVSHKHIELIVRQMFARRKIKDPGDTYFTRGDVVEVSEFVETNTEMKEKDLKEATGDPVVMGITEVSLSRSSFLSAASFQHTPRVLIQAAIRGSVDTLIGLKENVIIGRLIPAGTGFKGGFKEKLICEAVLTQSKKS